MDKTDLVKLFDKGYQLDTDINRGLQGELLVVFFEVSVKIIAEEVHHDHWFAIHDPMALILWHVLVHFQTECFEYFFLVFEE